MAKLLQRINSVFGHDDNDSILSDVSHNGVVFRATIMGQIRSGGVVRGFATTDSGLVLPVERKGNKAWRVAA